jgi:pilus assembly protein CpaE
MSPDRQAPQDRNLHILVVGSDPAFLDEFKNAFAGVPDRRDVVYGAATYGQALDVARTRQPDFVAVAIDRDLHGLTNFTREINQLLPGVVIAAAFQPDRMDEGGSESSVIIELLRAQIRDFLRRPLSTTELREVFDRLLSKVEPAASVARGRIISFISNKGGVGKSTLSVNVACALAERHPGQVLLVDTSLQLGICALMLDLTPTTTIVDAVRERERLDETLLRHLTLPHSSGVRLLAAPADALEASEVGDEAIARILNLARRAFQFVIIDTFPMLDNVVIAALDLSDLAFVVLQGTAPSVAGIARFLPVLEGLGFPAARHRIVLSRSYKRFLGDLTPADIESRLGRTLSYIVPYDKRILVSMNTGTPRIVHAPRWRGFGRVVMDIADSLDGFAQVPVAEPKTKSAADDARVRLGSDRRATMDRRIRDVGRPQGDRRTGHDRRSLRPEYAYEREVSL